MAALIVVVVGSMLALGLLTAGGLAALGRSTAARRFGARLALAREHLVADLTPAGAFVVLVATALGVTGAAGWVVGVWARRSQPADWDVFHWFAARQHSSMTSLMDELTRMGNRTEIKTLIVLASLAFVAQWRRRAWIPILALVVTFAAEHFLQRMLGLTIHRGHPPTDAGTFPSGGCARLVSIYGIVMYCAFAGSPLGRRARRIGFSVLAALGALEAFTRVYLQKHWASDTVGGLLVGAILLVTMVFAIEALGLSGDRASREAAEALPEQRKRAATPVGA